MGDDPFIDSLAPSIGEKILDIGAGRGDVADRVLKASKGAEVYAVDPDHRKVESMKRNHPAIISSVGRAESLPFPASYFDKAYATMALHHFSDLDKSIAEVARVLRQGGSFIILELEPHSGLGRFYRIFGRLMGEQMNVLTQDQLLTRLESAGGFRVEHSVRLDSRYLVQLLRT